MYFSYVDVISSHLPWGSGNRFPFTVISQPPLHIARICICRCCRQNSRGRLEHGYHESHGPYANVQRPGHTVHPHNWKCIWGGKWLAPSIALETAGGLGGGEQLCSVMMLSEKKGQFRTDPYPIYCPYTKTRSHGDQSSSEGPEKRIKKFHRISFFTIKRGQVVFYMSSLG